MSEPPPDIGRDAEDAAFAPTPQELERLLFAIESSLKVNRRFQFFLWAQGVLQSFMPHQIMIGVTGNLEAEQFEADVFSTEVVDSPSPEMEANVRTLVVAALREWVRNGRDPLCWCSEMQSRRPDDPLTAAVWELGLGHMMAHGTREIRGPNGSFVLFGRLDRKPRRRSRDVADLLMPYLHLAMHRYLMAERGDDGMRRHGATPMLSEREIQIIAGVRDGKTNGEIGVELMISPLTVKNHIQRILRKLGVNNRAQAVAKCLTLGMFEGSRRP